MEFFTTLLRDELEGELKLSTDIIIVLIIGRPIVRPALCQQLHVV